MRYKARKGDQGWFVFDEDNPGRMAISESVDEWEATAIEFTLNQLIEGRRLISECPVDKITALCPETFAYGGASPEQIL